jgi:DNA phosphorothioation-associated DGQHR protein 1
MSYPKKYKALKVKQPFGEFFVISIKAIDLLEVSFSDVLRYNEDGSLSGSQRILDEKKRLKEITDYIESEDLAFPNSIIIAANYNEEGFIVEDDEDSNIRWTFENISENEFEITIPSSARIAAIIDGQHRLKGFKDASPRRQNETDLIVAIYFDLPSPYQAYIFASINYNQKPVNKSLALEQFGYLTSLSPQKSWSPELLSVFLVRKLNTDKDSSFFNHIRVAPQNDKYLLEISPKEQDWLVSTATVVEGILRLISTSPKKDSNALNKLKENERLREVLPPDNSVLRSFYLGNNDVFIYKTVINFFNAVDEILFSVSSKVSFIKKTVGIQALFNTLRIILSNRLETDKDISVDYFKKHLIKVQDIDFSDNFFTASGIGKSRIQNAILIRLGFKEIDDIRKEEERPDYLRLTN